MSPIFAVLALCAFAIGAAALVGLILGKVGPARPAPILPLGIASAIAAVAMAGSLFYSEVANFEPCEFCWYQRIAMYPLAVILPIALIRRDFRIWPYGLAIATIGVGLSSYHYYLQHWFHGTTTCAVTNPCTAIWVEQFGFVTIPFMAGCGFFAISLLMLVLRRSTQSGPAVTTER
ncbi:MAG: disulfide bond formation protein B [Acidimicrobiia bacterium]|nr:disulfide bond formation protein B [Acidimicrobiia bacterium]